MRYFGERKTGVILAADLSTERENSRLLDQVVDLVDVVKIGSPLVYDAGIGVIRRLVDRFGKPIFADLKVADVPHTNAKIVRQVAANGGAAVMVHGIIGPDGLQDCVDASEGMVGIIVQLELTHPGGELFTQPIADDMARTASLVEVYGYQAPANRPQRIEAIRAIIGLEPVIVCCGVGVQGGSYGGVMAAGGTYAIIGRSVYLADQPRRVLADLVAGGPDGKPA